MAGNRSPISILSKSISDNAAVIEAYYEQNGLMHFTFQENGATEDSAVLPPAIAAAKMSLMEAAHELRDLAAGPRRIVQECANLEVFDFAVKHRIWELVGNGASYEQLSAKTGINKFALTRILRVLISHRFLLEGDDGIVRHSAASKCLAMQPVIAEALVDTIEEMHVKPSTFIGRALERFPHGQELHECAASLAYTPADIRRKFECGETERLWSFWDYIHSSATRTAHFAQTMMLNASQPGYSMNHLVDGYDWAALPQGATVVDMGGSHGGAAFALAEKFGHLKFVVQDRTEVIDNLPTSKDDERDGKVEFIAHDLFSPQSIKGAGVYLLRRVLHNWPDKYATQILRALVPAMREGSRVLVMDAVSPAHGTVPNLVERDIRKMDLTMLALFNAGDREAEHWRDLFEQSDKRFSVESITTPQGSACSLIEASWKVT